MPFAFVHLVTAWLAGKAHQSISKSDLSQYAWLFLLFGSIFPDTDHLLVWAFQFQVHRSFTHSILFAVISAITVYILFRSLKHAESRQFAMAIGGGIIIHVLLDSLSYPGTQLLWPSQLYFSITHIGYLRTPLSSLFHLPLPQIRGVLKLAVLDMAVGTAWLFYLALRKRVRF